MAASHDGPRPGTAARPRVVGMGSLLHGDEGVGVLAAHCLRAGYEFEPELEIADGAVLGFGALDLMADPDPVLLLDAVFADVPAGAVVRLDGDRLLQVAPEVRLAAHEVEPVQQLRLHAALGVAPPVVLLGVAAVSTAFGVGLSPAVRSAFPALLAAALEQLAAWGVHGRRVREVTPRDALAALTTRQVPG